MNDARARLLEYQHAKEPFAEDPELLAELRLQAAKDYFAERVGQVPLLRRMANEAGITEVTGEASLVPLLFSHTTYKSYPHAFLKKNQWERLQQWLRMVSAADIAADTSGIVDVDDWVNRLWEAGNKVATTSATSGKVSFLPRSDIDHAVSQSYVANMPAWQFGVNPDRSRHFFALSFKGGSHVAAFMGEMFARLYGRPDSTHFLFDHPLRVADVAAAGEFRTRLADGSATPGEIAAMEAANAAKAADGAARMQEILDKILQTRHEPQWILGLWGQMWMLVERAQAAGLEAGHFNPQTVLNVGGGIKGVAMPPDYEARIMKFVGSVKTRPSYGMSEMSWFMPACAHGRYHQIPWVIPLMLDKSGGMLLDPHEEEVEGRFGFLDLSLDGRWGGLISGDKVRMNSSTCPCGRPGATIMPAISRYSDVGDDRIGCAGTIDSYVRGALAA